MNVERTVALILGLGLVMACERNSPPEEKEATWELVQSGLPSALLSVWGQTATDVWAVGGDTRDGDGPLVVHYDGQRWERVLTGEAQGGLWWVFGFEDGPMFLGGEGGVILRYDDGAFTRMETPGNDTVYGLWGTAPDDMWAVGGSSDAAGGFAWRLVGDTWEPEPTLPAEIPGMAAVWKVFGTASDDAWLVGSSGVALHWDGAALTQGDTGVGSSLFTVHERDGRYTAVGGSATGIIVEYDGQSWQNVTPTEPTMGLTGVTLGSDGFGVAVGTFGTVLTRSAADGWVEADIGINIPHNFHGSWIDDEGGIWAVGGDTFSLTKGMLVHRGQAPISNKGL